MSSTVLQNKERYFLSIITGALFIISIILFGFIGITGCSSNVTSEDLPKDFIKAFMAKHETMVDKSLVYYYTKEDQPAVSEQIELACRINKSKGKLKILEKATFDFSGLRMELVEKKEDYVNDEPVVFLKVAVKGNYRMHLPEETRMIDADQVIILQMAHNEWKVSASNNPWS